MLNVINNSVAQQRVKEKVDENTAAQEDANEHNFCELSLSLEGWEWLVQTAMWVLYLLGFATFMLHSSVRKQHKPEFPGPKAVNHYSEV